MSNTYRIGLKNCVFFARHGVFHEEAQLGQSFYIDVDMDVLVTDALKTDNYENTVDYGAVHASVEQIVTQQRFNLIEALAHRVGEELCAQFPAIKRVVVTIRKPSAPIPGVFDHAEVIVEHIPE
ncbi:MAG: dihydroneopterin aldolase [Hyphomicrobiales bacterium]|nr:dihydroneopterin aldolase [Hyphomicrobiales bacterium]MCP4998638.1 dihydroneopterin aldolase [Hyphomicrobiales bacterium]